MKGEISREPHYFTSSEWVNRKEILLSGWPINKKAKSVGRMNAGATNMCLQFIRRMEKEGMLK